MPSEPLPHIPADVAARLRFWPALEYTAQVEVKFRKPVVFGETPDGLRINFYAEGGVLRGALAGRVLPNSADYMIIRRDGMGLIDIRATVETEDGARLWASEVGLVDFGEDAYVRLLSGEYQDTPRLQTYMRLLTDSAAYAWVHRISFLAVGTADMKELCLRYELFAVRTGVNPAVP